jgi:hypothetical protein
MPFIIHAALDPNGVITHPDFVGPVGVNPDIAYLLRTGNGIAFALATEAGERVARGLLIGAADGSHPGREALDAFGEEVNATRVLMATGAGTWVDIRV